VTSCSGKGWPRRQGGRNSFVGGADAGGGGQKTKPSFVVHLAGGHVGQGTRRNEGFMADMFGHVIRKSWASLRVSQTTRPFPCRVCWVRKRWVPASTLL